MLPGENTPSRGCLPRWLLPPLGGTSQEQIPPLGMPLPPRTSPPDVVLLAWASRHCQSVPCIKGRMRSETMFQWLLDSGLRFTAIFWPYVSSWGILSGSYSNMGEVASTKEIGKCHLMNQVLSRLLGQDSVEPEASELERSQGLISLRQRLSGGHVQQDGVLHHHRQYATHL